MANNIQEKNLIYGLQPFNEIPYPKVENIDYGSGNQFVNAAQLDNTYSQLVDNDMYVAQHLLSKQKFTGGPTMVNSSSIDDIESFQDGTKFIIGDIGPAVYQKHNYPLQSTLRKILDDVDKVNFIEQFDQSNVLIATDSALYVASLESIKSGSSNLKYQIKINQGSICGYVVSPAPFKASIIGASVRGENRIGLFELGTDSNNQITATCKVDLYSLFSSDNPTKVTSIAYDIASGVLAFSTANVVYAVDVDGSNKPISSTCKRLCSVQTSISGEIVSLQYVQEDSKSKLLVFTSKGRVHMLLGSLDNAFVDASIEIMSQSHVQVNDRVIKDGIEFYATSNGLMYSLANRTLVNVDNGFTSEVKHVRLDDAADNIWFGDASGNILCCNIVKNSPKIAQYMWVNEKVLDVVDIDPNVKVIATDNGVKYVCKDDGNPNGMLAQIWEKPLSNAQIDVHRENGSYSINAVGEDNGQLYDAYASMSQPAISENDTIIGLSNIIDFNDQYFGLDGDVFKVFSVDGNPYAVVNFSSNFANKACLYDLSTKHVINEYIDDVVIGVLVDEHISNDNNSQSKEVVVITAGRKMYIYSDITTSTTPFETIVNDYAWPENRVILDSIKVGDTWSVTTSSQIFGGIEYQLHQLQVSQSLMNALVDLTSYNINIDSHVNTLLGSRQTLVLSNDVGAQLSNAKIAAFENGYQLQDLLIDTSYGISSEPTGYVEDVSQLLSNSVDLQFIDNGVVKLSGYSIYRRADIVISSNADSCDVSCVDAYVYYDTREQENTIAASQLRHLSSFAGKRFKLKIPQKNQHAALTFAEENGSTRLSVSYARRSGIDNVNFFNEKKILNPLKLFDETDDANGIQHLLIDSSFTANDDAVIYVADDNNSGTTSVYVVVSKGTQLSCTKYNLTYDASSCVLTPSDQSAPGNWSKEDAVSNLVVVDNGVLLFTIGDSLRAIDIPTGDYCVRDDYPFPSDLDVSNIIAIDVVNYKDSSSNEDEPSEDEPSEDEDQPINTELFPLSFDDELFNVQFDNSCQLSSDTLQKLKIAYNDALETFSISVDGDGVFLYDDDKQEFYLSGLSISSICNFSQTRSSIDNSMFSMNVLGIDSFDDVVFTVSTKPLQIPMDYQTLVPVDASSTILSSSNWAVHGNNQLWFGTRSYDYSSSDSLSVMLSNGYVYSVPSISLGDLGAYPIAYKDNSIALMHFNYDQQLSIVIDSYTITSDAALQRKKQQIIDNQPLGLSALTASQAKDVPLLACGSKIESYDYKTTVNVYVNSKYTKLIDYLANVSNVSVMQIASNADYSAIDIVCKDADNSIYVLSASNAASRSFSICKQYYDANAFLIANSTLDRSAPYAFLSKADGSCGIIDVFSFQYTEANQEDQTTKDIAGKNASYFCKSGGRYQLFANDSTVCYLMSFTGIGKDAAFFQLSNVFPVNVGNDVSSYVVDVVPISSNTYAVAFTDYLFRYQFKDQYTQSVAQLLQAQHCIGDLTSYSRSTGIQWLMSDGADIVSSKNFLTWGDVLSIGDDGSIPLIRQFDDYTLMAFKQDAGLYSTHYEYEYINNTQTFNSTSAQMLYDENEAELLQDCSSAVETHIEDVHDNPNDQINAINSLMSIDFDVGVDFTKTASSSNAIAISNDYMLRMFTGTSDDNVVHAYAKNKSTGDSWKEAKCSYIAKCWNSGFVELYVHIDTTQTYYIPHVRGAGFCPDDTISVRAGGAYVPATVEDNTTSVMVQILSAYFTFDNICENTVKPNSLPLRVYKDTLDNAPRDKEAVNMWHSFVLPSIASEIDLSSAKFDYYNAMYYCFGSDAQALKIAGWSSQKNYLKRRKKVIYHPNGGYTADFKVNQDIVQYILEGDDPKTMLWDNVFENNGAMFTGWALTPYNDGNPDEKYPEGTQFSYDEIDGEWIELYAAWVFYEFSDNDTTMTLGTSQNTDYTIAEITIDPDMTVANDIQLGNKVVIDFGDT